MANKKDMADGVCAGVEGLTKKQATDAVDYVFRFITETLKKGEKVQIPGFGVLQVSERAARQGRNPKTGEAMTIAASKNIKFRPGKELKDAVNG